ncbi:unnamed protein product [Closterium sp. Yama58-4]|nr:unnamed protein product [Closterium sp. Yama58-4]
MKITRVLLVSLLLGLLLATSALGKKDGGNGGGKGGGNGGGNGGGGGKGGGKGGGWKGPRFGKKGKGKIAGAASATLRGGQAVDASGNSIGDKDATGVIDLVLVRNDTVYDLYFQVGIALTDSGEPTSVTVNEGAEGTNGNVVMDLTADITWTDTTGKAVAGHRYGKKKKGRGCGGGFFGGGKDNSLGDLNSYYSRGVIRDASSRTNDQGDTYLVAMQNLLDSPDSYYGLVKTAAYTEGAARGQFVKGPKGWGVWRNRGFCFNCV